MLARDLLRILLINKRLRKQNSSHDVPSAQIYNSEHLDTLLLDLNHQLDIQHPVQSDRHQSSCCNHGSDRCPCLCRLWRRIESTYQAAQNQLECSHPPPSHNNVL